MKITDLNDICGGFQMPMVAVKTTLLFFVILLSVKADVQQPPVPPTATRPTVDKFMKREHSLIKPFQGKLNHLKYIYTRATSKLTSVYFIRLIYISKNNYVITQELVLDCLIGISLEQQWLQVLM